MKCDLLYINGNILTLDEQNTRVKSVAVYEGNIVGTWDTNTPQEDEVSVTDDTKVVDLHGKIIIPGFVDTHNHLFMYSQAREQVDCTTPPNKSINDILERIKERATKLDPNQWIVGWGYDDTLLQEKRHITRKELDKIVPDQPVFIRHISGHLGVVNSKALELAGVTEDIENPKGAHFGRDEEGMLDGVLYELPVLAYIWKALPTPSVDEMVDKIERAAKDYLAVGITTNSDAGVGLDMGKTEFDVHIKAINENKNPLRMRFMVLYHLLQGDGPFSEYTAEELDHHIQKLTDGKARLDSAKLFQDGSIQGFTGALRKPYYTREDEMGELVMDQEVLDDLVQDFHDRGFRVTTHGNGDRAIGSIIKAYIKALKKNPKKDHRHRIEHLQTATPEDLDNMKAHDIAASFFVNHVYYWGDRHRDIFLGPERAERLDPVADAVERDILYTLHSDCPITMISPLFSIWAAVNRVTRSGKTLGEAQKISVIEALKSMTIYGAKLNFEEDITGSIEVGKRADFAILDQDPTQIDPMLIKDIEVIETIIGGESCFVRE